MKDLLLCLRLFIGIILTVVLMPLLFPLWIISLFIHALVDDILLPWVTK